MDHITFVTRDKNIEVYPDKQITKDTKINFFDVHFIKVYFEPEIKAYYKKHHLFTIKKTSKDNVYKLFDLNINDKLHIKYSILYACLIVSNISKNGILVSEDNLTFNDILLSKKLYKQNKTLFFEQYGFIYNLKNFSIDIFDNWDKNNFIQTKTNNELIRRLYMFVYLGDQSSIIINIKNRK
tara:strand:+ start:2337 stop:2882 length:546 start_codon:yes stop_codon:yes gene_type:complete